MSACHSVPRSWSPPSDFTSSSNDSTQKAASPASSPRYPLSSRQPLPKPSAKPSLASLTKPCNNGPPTTSAPPSLLNEWLPTKNSAKPSDRHKPRSFSQSVSSDHPGPLP